MMTAFRSERGRPSPDSACGPLRQQPSKLSVVVPCFNEEAGLPEFHRRMSAACRLSSIDDYEIIYINDGSSDQTLRVLRSLQMNDDAICIVDLARNHGHQIALSAGLTFCRGSHVLVIDADLQDPPEVLTPMLEKLEQGADVVYAQRKRRHGESMFKIATASLFYRMLSRISGTPIPLDTGDFRLMRRRVVNILLQMPESHRFVRGMVAWAGFRQVPFEYERDPRFAGDTKYPFLKMLTFSLDAITAFATAPLRIVFILAIISLCLAFVLLLRTFYAFFFLDTVPGWSSLMVIFLFFTSVQLFSLAVIGEYVGRTFIETKRRPLYVVKEIFPPRDRSSVASDDIEQPRGAVAPNA